MKPKIFVFATLAVILGLIVKIVWDEEAKNILPTPIPHGFKDVAVDQRIMIDRITQKQLSKPVFLHFFNPDCPCSRFNMEHFEKLVKTYKGRIEFYAVIQTKESGTDGYDFNEKYGLDIPSINDPAGELARKCGVYSTPQAVLLDTTAKLYYKGNYNKARYCTAKNSDFANMAIESLLANKPAPYFGSVATQSYGCILPSDKKNDMAVF